MKSTVIAFITLFSCTYIWHPVAAQWEDCRDMGSCYSGYTGVIFYTFQVNGDRFCNIVGSTAEACLDGLNLTQICSNSRDFVKAVYPYLCSLPREDVSASLQCFIDIDIETAGTICDAATAPFEDTTGPLDACKYYIAILDCYRDAMMSRCPDHVGPVLHYFTTQFYYMYLRPNDCHVFQEPDTAGAGTLALPSPFYWIETAMIALYISTWLYAK